MKNVHLASPSNKRVQSGDLPDCSKRPRLYLPSFDDPKLVEEEECMYKLFQEVLDFFKDEHFKDDFDVRQAVDRIITSFRYDLGNQFSDIDLSKPDNICGYLQRYTIHGAGLMRQKTLQAFCNCPALRRGLRQTKLRVVSLGGGPGNDVVGFLSALQELGPNGCDIKITVADAVGEWSRCVRLVKHFVRVGSFGSVSELVRNNAVDMAFERMTLPGDPVEDDCYVVVENADVIIISKVISVLTREQKTLLIENLHDTMRDSSVILLVDSPFEREMWKDFDVLYLSEEGQTYELHPVVRAFNPHFDELKPVSSKSRIAVLRKKNKVLLQFANRAQ